MKPDDIISASFSRQEWALVMFGLGELPTKHTYSLVKKLEELLKEPAADGTPGTTVDPV